jgi:4-hydroxybenzoate polyprenyltransferase
LLGSPSRLELEAGFHPDDPALALRLFRSNRDAGFILLSAIILGAVSWPF